MWSDIWAQYTVSTKLTKLTNGSYRLLRYVSVDYMYMLCIQFACGFEIWAQTNSTLLR